MQPIRILLIDDHPIMRAGLRLLLQREPDFAVVGEASDGVTALRQIEILQPDVAVIDIAMPGLSGLEVARRLPELWPDLRALILSGHTEAPLVHEAIRAGVAGFLAKAGAATELVKAVRAVVSGEMYFCEQAFAVLSRDEGPGAARPALPAAALSQREIDILRGIADGRATKEIARLLAVSVRTVESDRANLMSRLGIFSIAGLTKYALREGITAL